jgi:hypothetical protein
MNQNKPVNVANNYVSHLDFNLRAKIPTIIATTAAQEKSTPAKVIAWWFNDVINSGKTK